MHLDYPEERLFAKSGQQGWQFFSCENNTYLLIENPI